MARPARTASLGLMAMTAKTWRRNAEFSVLWQSAKILMDCATALLPRPASQDRRAGADAMAECVSLPRSPCAIPRACIRLLLSSRRRALAATEGPEDAAAMAATGDSVVVAHGPSPVQSPTVKVARADVVAMAVTAAMEAAAA